MKRFLNKQYILSVFFFLLFIGVFVINQFDLLKGYKTVEIVVAKEVIEKDTVITKDDLMMYPYDREVVQNDMYRQMDEIIGKTTTQKILPVQYVSSQAVDPSILKPTKEHEFFPIPDAWLIQLQGTLRRYDLINISAVYAEEDSQETEALTLTKTELIQKDYILQDVPVAFVKSSRNEEVTGIGKGNDRLNGNQNASNIELSLTIKEFKDLEELFLKGYKFVLSYK